MNRSDIVGIIQQAESASKTVYLSHKGIWRDVYVYEVKRFGGEWCLYVFCTLHPYRLVECMKVVNVDGCRVGDVDALFGGREGGVLVESGWGY